MSVATAQAALSAPLATDKKKTPLEYAAELRAGFEWKTAKREAAIEWAQELIDTADFLILDTETTGFPPNAEAIEIGLVDVLGDCVFHRLVAPVGQISDGARKVHGITDDELAGAPDFAEVYWDFAHAILGKRILIYNKVFDCEVLNYQAALAGLKLIFGNKYAYHIFGMNRVIDVMAMHSSYLETTSWLKLPDAGHRVVDDCQATLKLLGLMAASGD